MPEKYLNLQKAYVSLVPELKKKDEPFKADELSWKIS